MVGVVDFGVIVSSVVVSGFLWVFFFFFSRCLEVEGEREGKGREREIVKNIFK